MNLQRLVNILSSVYFLTLMIAALSLTTITRSLQNVSTHIGQAIESVRAAEEIRINLLAHSKESFLYAMTGNEVHRAQQKARADDVRFWLKAADEHISSADEEEELLELRRRVQAYFETIDRLNLETTAPREAYREVSQVLANAAEKAQGLTQMNMRQSHELGEQAKAEGSFADWLGVVYILLCLISFPLMWIFFWHWIYTPLRKLHRSIITFDGSAFKVEGVTQGVAEIQGISAAFSDLVQRLGEQKSQQVRFLAGVAHDLRNPLSAIKLATEILHMDGGLSRKEEAPMLGIIGSQVSQLDRMVGDLLDAARIDAGQLELRKSRQDLVPLLREVVLLHKKASPTRNVQFESPEALYSACDPLRINQVLHNFLSNAIKYSPEGSEIEVSLRGARDYAEIVVRDHGIGISADDLQKIFEPFRRTKATKETIPGVGLGLSVAKTIVEAHGGQIEVKSELGRGSSFIVRLPLAAEGRPSEAALS